jgi:hypothetical protein
MNWGEPWRSSWATKGVPLAGNRHRSTAMLNRSELLDVAMLGIAMLLAASTAFA